MYNVKFYVPPACQNRGVVCIITGLECSRRFAFFSKRRKLLRLHANLESQRPLQDSSIFSSIPEIVSKTQIYQLTQKLFVILLHLLLYGRSGSSDLRPKKLNTGWTYEHAAWKVCHFRFSWSSWSTYCTTFPTEPKGGLCNSSFFSCLKWDEISPNAYYAHVRASKRFSFSTYFDAFSGIQVQF